MLIKSNSSGGWTPVPGKGTYTVTGETSTDAALTHINIAESSLDDILSIIARIQGGG